MEAFEEAIEKLVSANSVKRIEKDATDNTNSKSSVEVEPVHPFYFR